MKARLLKWVLASIAFGALGRPWIGWAASGSLVPTFPTETSRLRDEWIGIATATNQWATAIRQSDGWEKIVHASTEEIRAMAEQGLAVAQLKLGYFYLSGEGAERDYQEATTRPGKAAEAGLAPAQFLIG